ncbi:hypothetical protein B0H66DRAFT_113289 [Apodospora peruviana]|uniref:CCHC-type domain-containing protein n=1 Tax=Apodospora peruviana TaxID=516989 RepID=A0AAE0MBQ1_9PEZI|nr:hypothetical protein B0H66DRAFT_113289 [Apodospora peruviana]
MSSTQSSAGRKRAAKGGGIRNDPIVIGELSEPESDPEPLRKKSKVDTSARTPSSSADEGEIRDSSPEEELLEEEETDTEAERTASHNRWNRGVGGGLRTSFVGSGKSTLSRTPVEAAPDVIVLDESESSDVETRTFDNWSMPNPADFEEFLDKPGKIGGQAKKWKARFKTWYDALIKMNPDQGGLRDQTIVHHAWRHWLDNMESLAPRARRIALFAATAYGKGKGVLDDWKNWVLPPSPPLSDLTAIGIKHAEAWQAKFFEWCQEVISLNGNIGPPSVARERLVLAHDSWIATINGLNAQSALSARRAAQVIAAGEPGPLRAKLVRMLNAQRESELKAERELDKAPQTLSNGAVNGQASALRSPAAEAMEVSDFVHRPPSIDEQAAHRPLSIEEQREVYFPRVGPDEEFCVMCAHHGHSLVDCPELTCRFCGGDDHFTHKCPTRRRCTKCRQLGHSREGCHEKLALPKDQMECAFCQSRKHIETSCAALYRFQPDPNRIRKVKALPVYCYLCGKEGHYGADCLFNRQQPAEPELEVWCMANAQQYLDPRSTEVALEFQYSGQRVAAADPYARPDFGGRSIVPQRHVFFEADEDDDDNEPFIRPAPPRQPQNAGRITFSSFSSSNNGRGGGGNRGGRNTNGHRSNGYRGPQPPLPPVPPQRHGGGGGKRGRGGRFRGRGGSK